VPSIATGKGELIEPIKYRVERFILTVTPDLSVSTALAYSLVTPTGRGESSLAKLLLELGDHYQKYKDYIVNDFEESMFEKFPVIGKIKSEMYSHGAEFALMSGSGSSVYGFFKSRTDTEKAADSLRSNFVLRAADVTPPVTLT